jgi:hypothetical protein
MTSLNLTYPMLNNTTSTQYIMNKEDNDYNSDKEIENSSIPSLIIPNWNTSLPPALLLISNSSDTNNTRTHIGLSEDTTTTTSSPIVIVWSSILVFLFCYSIRPSIPDPSHRTALIRQQRQLRREARRNDPKRRQAILNQSLITKVCS